MMNLIKKSLSYNVCCWIEIFGVGTDITSAKMDKLYMLYPCKVFLFCAIYRTRNETIRRGIV